MDRRRSPRALLGVVVLRTHTPDPRRQRDGGADPFSSAWHFDGWSHDRWRRGLDPPTGAPCVAPAESWLMAEGWRRHGAIGIAEVPGAARKLYPSREAWLGMAE